mgnify:CR=1 FL=1
MGQKNKGTFYKEQNGTWTIDTKVKVDGVYKHFKRRGYATLTDAKNDFEQAKQMFIDSRYLNRTIESFDDLTREYLEKKELQVVKGTFSGFKSIIKVFIQPFFSSKPIKNAIRQDMVSHWYNYIVADKNHTVIRKNSAISLMKDIIHFAYSKEYIDARTFQTTDIILISLKEVKQKREKVVWTKEEREHFFQTVDNAKDYIMFYTLFELGLRIGELLALQPKCIDFKTNKVFIFQQCEAHNKMQITERLKTKTSYRSIIMTSKLAKMIKDYICDFNLSENDFLFYSTNKMRPMVRASFENKLSNLHPSQVKFEIQSSIILFTKN